MEASMPEAVAHAPSGFVDRIDYQPAALLGGPGPVDGPGPAGAVRRPWAPARGQVKATGTDA